jgi:cytidylate kinase
MILYGLGGTNGSGKDTIAQLLVDRHNFLFVSTSDLLREEARKRGLSTDRENLRTISAEWRREYGLGVLVDKAVDYFNGLESDKYKGLVVSSLRNPAEADAIRAYGGKMLWIDADPRVRFERLNDRAREDDPKTFEQFMSDEEAEMLHSGDAATLSLAGVKERADIFIMNDGSDHTELAATLQKQLGL